MKTSASGRALIEQREGRRLTAYRDQKGILTIGVGHTGRMSPPSVRAGMTITEVECDTYLATDLAPVEAAINAQVKVRLSQNEFDAMASWLFNEGAGALTRSQLLKRLNVGDIAGAAADFMNWCKPASLTSRRQSEKAQFLRPDSLNAAAVSPSLTVANARAASLATRAATKRSSAQIKQNGGGALAIGGSVTAAVTATAGHGHVATWIFGIVVVGAAIDGALSIWHRVQAATLAANASKQVVAAAAIAKAQAPADAAAPVSHTA